jgi:ABC-type sugar transport system ATPase subunit
LQVGSFALRGVSFTVGDGDYAVLMGKTGSGKTTLLEAICGLNAVRGGRILLRGQDVTNLPPADRKVGYVPQDLALFPTLTVREHLGFALEVRKENRTTLERRVGELADLLGLRPLLDRLPAGLSGGESQRVALGRALAFHPPVLLLDEPLSALDEEMRGEMMTLLRTMQKQTGVTTLHVTHNVSEAKHLADRFFRLKDGRVQTDESP